MKKEVVISLGALLIVIGVGFCCFYLYQYTMKDTCKDYFSVLGIDEVSIQYFEKQLLNNPSNNIVDLDSKTLMIEKDGYDIFLRKNYSNTTEYHYSFMRIDVNDDKYKFEHNKVSLGTEKGVVENVYKRHDMIKDLPDNQVGYIIDSLWVCFEFNDSNIVEKIILYFGP